MFGGHEVVGAAKVIDEQGLGVPWTPAQFADLYEGVMSRFDALHDAYDPEALAMLRHADEEWQATSDVDEPVIRRSRRRAAILPLLRSGVGYATISTAVGTTTDELIREVRGTRCDAGPSVVVEATDLLRAGRQFAAVARQLNISTDVVSTIAKMIGVTAPTPRGDANTRIDGLAADGLDGRAIHSIVSAEFPDLNLRLDAVHMRRWRALNRRTERAVAS